MLRKIRLTLAIIFFAILTLLFLDFTGTIHTWFGWMAKIQFVPALLALNAGVILILLVLTLVFGRVYCSVICPLGVFQDAVSWINGKRGRKHRMRFSYSPAISWLRYTVLVLAVVAFVAGIGSFVALVDPYSAYGRIVSNIFAPVYYWFNNLLAGIAERIDSYAFYEKDVWLKSLPTFIIAAVTLVAVTILAWRNGRTYCNTFCPVGTVLGWLSRFSIFAVKIDKDKCTACSLCSRGCKASCIDSVNHHIDYSRCVACMDCIDNCSSGAISFGRRYVKKEKTEKKISDRDSAAGKTNVSRRTFISASAVAAVSSALKAQEKKVDGGLAVIEDKAIPERNTPIVPPGAKGIRNFYRHCTACQLCVSVCPNNVLRPSGGLERLMQPEMSYERGYCRPECTKCSEVCPAGAILPVTVEEKTSVQIGHAVWIKKNCIPVRDGEQCGNCARHCPSGAIQMIPLEGRHRRRHGAGEDAEEETLLIPAIDTEKCIGCGACENLCPSRPFTAIYVEGHEVHSEI